MTAAGTGGPAARAYFTLCSGIGWLLRSAAYASTHVIDADGVRLVRKRRRAYATVLLWLAGPLMTLLETGVRVLPQREWEARERGLYERLGYPAIRVAAGGVIVLPVLPGCTLATLLEDPEIPWPVRRAAMERAAVALASLHRCGVTHGDAAAGNVLVDWPRARARWFDFETVHEACRPASWCRADDVHALLTSCVARVGRTRRAETVALVLDAYADEDVTRVLAAIATPVWRRSLAFHLALAPLPFDAFLEMGRLLRARACR